MAWSRCTMCSATHCSCFPRMHAHSLLPLPLLLLCSYKAERSEARKSAAALLAPKCAQRLATKALCSARSCSRTPVNVGPRLCTDPLLMEGRNTWKANFSFFGKSPFFSLSYPVIKLEIRTLTPIWLLSTSMTIKIGWLLFTMLPFRAYT